MGAFHGVDYNRELNVEFGTIRLRVVLRRQNSEAINIPDPGVGANNNSVTGSL
jgi:hypothetical protein